MNTATCILLPALLANMALFASNSALADNDRWRRDDHPRWEQHWKHHHDHGRHEGWHKDWRDRQSERTVVYFGPTTYYGAPVFYERRVYRSEPTVVIDLPPIIFR